MGRLRGKRNRDQDRYWQERRRAEQVGMIAAMPAIVCVACDALIISEDAIYESEDVFCRRCALKLGLASYHEYGSQGPTRPEIGGLNQVDGLGWGDQGESRSNRHHLGFAVGYSVIALPRSACSSRSGYDQEHRARLWLGRLREFRGADADILSRAVDVVVSSPTVRADIKALRAKVYRQQFPRRASEIPRKFTDAQIENIRTVYASGTQSLKRLGREYGVTGATIHAIVTGSLYKRAGGPIHVPDPARVNYWGHGLYGGLGGLWVPDAVA